MHRKRIFGCSGKGGSHGKSALNPFSQELGLFAGVTSEIEVSFLNVKVVTNGKHVGMYLSTTRCKFIAQPMMLDV